MTPRPSSRPGDSAGPELDSSSKDSIRLLRCFGMRALALALLFFVGGMTTLAALLALIGLGLILIPLSSIAESQSECA